MVILFVVNMISGFEDARPVARQKKVNLGGWIAGPGSTILPGISYAICPVQAGFAFTQSLFEQFDEIVFLKDHDNYIVRIRQAELEHNLTEVVNNNRKQESQMLYFGCSHTYGDGHSDKSTVYPSVLSKLLNTDYINLGMPGKSNYDIEDLMNCYNLERATVVVQFTDMYRIRYSDNSNNIKSDAIHRLIDRESKYNFLLSEENLFFNFQQIVLRTLNRLRENGSKFLITFTCNYENDYDLKCLEYLHQYNEFCSHVGTVVDVAEDNTHYGVQSHRLWAEKLYKKWVEIYGHTGTWRNLHI